MSQMPPDHIELRTENSLLVVSPAAGGSITRFASTRGGSTVEWLRPALPDAVANRTAGATSSFPMVPFSNRIQNGTFSLDGRRIQLPQNFQPEPHAIHGHGWRNPWNIVSRSDSTLTIDYHHLAAAWPWSYRAQQRFSLTATDLRVRFTVTNESSSPMPLGFGLHPYFIRTPKVRLRATVGRMWRVDDTAIPDALVAPPNELAFPADGLNPNATILDNNFIGFAGRARIEWPEWQARLDLVADPIYSCLVIYTPENRDFFCAEPATNCIDAFNLANQGRTDTGLIMLEPSDTAVGDVIFAPTFLD